LDAASPVWKGKLGRGIAVLRPASTFAVESLVKVLAVFFAFAFLYTAARFFAVGAFRTGVLVVEIVALVALSLATAVAVWATFGPQRVERLRRYGRAEALGAALAAVGFATGTFAAVTALFYDGGQLELEGARLSAAVGDDAKDTFSGIAADFYLWHLLDSVPLLDIPETIRWKKPYEYTDHLSGWLLLGFKAFVIFPLIQAVRLVWGRRPAPEAVRRARSRRGAARQAPP
jgi:hypothetical protein